MNAVCFRRPDPTGLALDRERLYWELSRLTHGVTRLGHYTLDEDSLCVSGEQRPLHSAELSSSRSIPPSTPTPVFFIFLLHLSTSPLSCPLSAGYTHQTPVTATSGEYT